MADAAIQTLARQMELLVQQVAALSSHLGQNSAAAPLPTYAAAIAATPSTASCTTPACQTTCVTLLIFYALSFLAIAQRVYTDLITAVQSPSTDAPSLPTAHDPMPSNSMSQSSRNRFVERNGRVYYVANSGRQYDIAAPPPYECKRCRQYHWAWLQCPTYATPHLGQLYYQNSHTGGPGAAYVPPPSH